MRIFPFPRRGSQEHDNTHDGRGDHGLTTLGKRVVVDARSVLPQEQCAGIAPAGFELLRKRVLLAG
jgi:hypothetical protein